MKFLLFAILIPVLLFAVEVPFSNVPVKTTDNHLGGMERIAPADRKQIPLKTDCWFWHDGKNLYAYWELEINDKFYPGAFATRDDNQVSDYVRLQFRTLPNEDFAYYFMAYPRGTSVDAVRKDNFQIDKAWNSLYYCESEYSGNLWKVTMVIPFKDLRYEGKQPYYWSVGTARQVYDDNSAYGKPFMPTTGVTARQYFDSFEPLIIRESIETPQNYRLIPYFYRSYDNLTKTQSYDPDHLGLNVIYRPGINSSLKLAFNPDFTETPIDEERDSHNDKYPPQLTENRIFFTEDFNAFGVSESQFYTRHIMQPKYALKYTANGKNWNFSALSAQDKETTDNGQVINTDDYFNIIAFKPKWGPFSNQFTFLSRNDSKFKNNNYVFYSSPFYQASSSFSITSKLIYSLDQYNGEEYKQGYLLGLSMNKRFDKFNTNFSAYDISKYYYPGMGAPNNQYDVNLYSLRYSAGFDNYFSDSFVRTISTGSDGQCTFEKEMNNQLRNNYFGLYFNTDYANQTSSALSAGYGNDRVNGNLLNWYNGNASFNWNCFLMLNGYIGADISQSIQYSLGETKPKYNIYGGINGYLGSVISYVLRNNHIIWKNFPENGSLDNEYDITNLDLDFTFSNNLKLVTGARYNNYQAGATQHIGYFCTLHWLYNSSTAIYLGFKSTEDEIQEKFQQTSGSSWFKISKTF